MIDPRSSKNARQLESKVAPGISAIPVAGR